MRKLIAAIVAVTAIFPAGFLGPVAHATPATAVESSSESTVTSLAGGCSRRSANGWTIDLCASHDGLGPVSDLYVRAKGNQANCYFEAYATIYGEPHGYYGIGCGNIQLNSRYVIGRTIGGPGSVTTTAYVREAVHPFRTWFNQSASFNV